MVERDGNFRTREKISIVTPVTRVNNIKYMIDGVEKGYNYFDIDWYIILDVTKNIDTKVVYNLFSGKQIVNVIIVESNDTTSIMGYGQKNYALDNIKDGYVWFLDDDNLVHENFFIVINELLKSNPNGIIMKQKLETFERDVNPGMLRETHVDQAQYFLRRDYIGNKRYFLRYCADGEFIETLYKNNPNNFIFHHGVLCYYNRLRWKDFEHIW